MKNTNVVKRIYEVEIHGYKVNYLITKTKSNKKGKPYN